MTVQVVILLVLFPLAAVLLVIEYRIMRKPRAERTARQQALLDADIKSSASYRRRTLRAYPALVAVFAIVVVVLAIPYWFMPRHFVTAIIVTVSAVVLGVAGLIAERFFLSAKGGAWIEKTNREFADAAEHSQPHWFISFKAGIAVGTVFTLLGLALVAVQIVDTQALIGFVLPAVVFLAGIAALVAAIAQRKIARAS